MKKDNAKQRREKITETESETGEKKRARSFSFAVSPRPRVSFLRLCAVVVMMKGLYTIIY